jgi:membrane protein implicated in regulation of membrane protease activity
MAINRWGICGVVLMAAGLLVGTMFTLWLHDQRNYHLPVYVLLQVAAAASSIVAIKRGSWWWLIVTLSSLFLAAQAAIALFVE